MKRTIYARDWIDIDQTEDYISFTNYSKASIIIYQKGNFGFGLTKLIQPQHVLTIDFAAVGMKLTKPFKPVIRWA